MLPPINQIQFNLVVSLILLLKRLNNSTDEQRLNFCFNELSFDEFPFAFVLARETFGFDGATQLLKVGVVSV